jgi:hypothetical protein
MTHEIKLTLEDPAELARWLHAHAGQMPQTWFARADQLDAIAHQIEEQVKPAIEEPTGDVLVFLGGEYWQKDPDADGKWIGSFDNTHATWEQLTANGAQPDIYRNEVELTELSTEVLRVGIGEPEPRDEWRALEVANAQEDARAQGWSDCKRKLRERFIQLASSAITSERKDAWRQALDALDDLS